jgi:DNA-directed RNA polymerase specialized sigma24 family protein
MTLSPSPVARPRLPLLRPFAELAEHARPRPAPRDKFAEEARRARRPIFLFVRRLVRNYHDAEDVTQTVFLRACRGRGGAGGGGGGTLG